jgi:hypothetical protein
VVSRGLVGSAARYIVGGTLVSTAGVRDLFLAAAAAGLAAAGWYARRLRTLAPPPHGAATDEGHQGSRADRAAPRSARDTFSGSRR